MADINVLDLTPTTPGSNDSLILFDRTTGEGKSTRFDTLSSQVLDSKFGDSNPTAGQELSYDATTGKYKNTSQIASLNEALTNEIATTTANGAHNLLPISASTQVVNGITFTVNSDGTVTVSGNATGYAYLDLTSDYIELGDYTISGCPSGGSASTYYLAIRMTQNSTWYRQEVETGNGYTITPTDKANANRMNLRISVEPGTSIVSPIVFKPMIRLASDTDPTYQPYAMTNRGLTEKVNDYEDILIINQSSWKGSTISHVYGNLVRNGRQITITLYWDGSATSTQAILNVPEKYIPKVNTYGEGTVYFDDTVRPGLYVLTRGGILTQQTIQGACTKGSATFTYVI